MIPTLDVLAIQTEQIRTQIDTLRMHLREHRVSAWGDAAEHLDAAIAYCKSGELLSTHVHAGITCAMDCGAAEEAAGRG